MIAVIAKIVGLGDSFHLFDIQNEWYVMGYFIQNKKNNLRAAMFKCTPPQEISRRGSLFTRLSSLSVAFVPRQSSTRNNGVS